MTTPSRKKAVKRIVRRKYNALASSVVQSEAIFSKCLIEIARKIKFEMQKFSSRETDSLLRDTHEAVKQFSWTTVYLEMKRYIPTLITLLSEIIPSSPSKEKLLSMVASLILKSRHQQMCLVQRAISVMMYGNECNKHVRKI